MMTRAAWKHHGLWGGVTFFLIALMVMTCKHVGYIAVGFGSLTDRVLILAIGQGALYLGFPEDGDGFDWDIITDVLDHFAWMPGIVEEVPYIPLWWLVLIPIGFWGLAIYRLSRRSSESETNTSTS